MFEQEIYTIIYFLGAMLLLWIGVKIFALKNGKGTSIRVKSEQEIKVISKVPLEPGLTLHLVECENDKFLIAASRQKNISASFCSIGPIKSLKNQITFLRQVTGMYKLLFIFLLSCISLPTTAMTQDFSSLGIPAITGTGLNSGEIEYSLSLQILALMTAITLIPSLVLGMTSFTRIIIVLSILRQALGTQQTPPNQVLIAIALFLSFFVMSPVLISIYDTALEPYLSGSLSAGPALETTKRIVHDFLILNTRAETIRMFADLRGIEEFNSTQDVPLSILLPSFMTSELKTAFQIGFLLFLPFLVIDMVIASVLMSLGMMMLSPMLISLPFKLLLFVLVDGWSMTIGSLASTFQM